MEGLQTMIVPKWLIWSINRLSWEGSRIPYFVCVLDIAKSLWFNMPKSYRGFIGFSSECVRSQLEPICFCWTSCTNFECYLFKLKVVIYPTKKRIWEQKRKEEAKMGKAKEKKKKKKRLWQLFKNITILASSFKRNFKVINVFLLEGQNFSIFF